MKFVWLSLLVSYCGLIFYLSHQSSLPAPMLFMHQDKVLHATCYAVLGYLAFNVFLTCLKNTQGVWLIAFVFCALYGASDEWHQSFVPGRDADAFDWLADCVGALSAVFLIERLRAKNQITTNG